MKLTKNYGMLNFIWFEWYGSRSISDQLIKQIRIDFVVS